MPIAADNSQLRSIGLSAFGYIASTLLLKCHKILF
jgi:hypothetical protein